MTTLTELAPIFKDFDKILGLIKKLVEKHSKADPEFDKACTISYFDECELKVSLPVVFKKGGEGEAMKIYNIDLQIEVVEET